MAACDKGVSVESFYGPKSARQVRIEAKLKRDEIPSPLKNDPPFMSRLLGPSRTWRVFKKQQDAINFCLEHRNGLMCFAFEQEGGHRLFLVAHPKVFWAVNFKKFYKQCSFYEIIRAFSACKLYLDIEYEYRLNSKDHNGDRMLKNFLHIINVNLHEFFGINCTMDHILDLDSSNELKYSHHIIYQIPQCSFQDNYTVGNFVCNICNDLKNAYSLKMSGCEDNIQKIAEKYQLMERDILEMFVFDSREKIRLFVDEGVYTKNRHFRLLGSTKLHRNCPLRVSANNKYKPTINDEPDLCMFLDSLITYFSVEINRVLEFSSFEINEKQRHVKKNGDISLYNPESCPAYSEVDKFVKSLISPLGQIRRKSFFSSSSRIIYDISGYRYCDNIKRHHKSNNIMFVIDLIEFTYYQKCYDPDCSDFKSNATKLPEELCFLLGDDSEFEDFICINGKQNINFLEDNGFSNSEIEALSFIEDLVSNPGYSDFYDECMETVPKTTEF